MSKYKEGDKIVIEITNRFKNAYGYEYYSILDSLYSTDFIDEKSEPLSTYTEPMKAKIRRQAAEITRLLAENKRLKAENGNSLWNIEQARAEGQNEAWELARKIFNMEVKDIEDIFIETGAWNLGTVLENYIYPEAAAKVAVWEKAKEEICVGDVVRFKENNNVEFCVTDILDDSFLYGINAEGGVYSNRDIELFEKTGRHIDIDSFLKQIGEEE